VNSQTDAEKHYIQPVHYAAGTQQEAHNRLLQIPESEKRRKIMTAQENYIRNVKSMGILHCNFEKSGD
jgi:uncharacterized protein (DUF1499 family)